MSEEQIAKLRRFALTVGLVLFTYSIAGVELERSARIQPLGIPLVIKRADLLGIGLVLAACYATSRYWFYAMVLMVSPIRARRRLKRGHAAHSEPGAVLIQQVHVGIAAAIARYFPSVGILRAKHVKYSLLTQADKPVEIHSIPFGTRLVTALESLDYATPVLVNIIAILTYFGVFGWTYSSLLKSVGMR